MSDSNQRSPSAKGWLLIPRVGALSDTIARPAAVVGEKLITLPFPSSEYIVRLVGSSPRTISPWTIASVPPVPMAVLIAASLSVEFFSTILSGKTATAEIKLG